MAVIITYDCHRYPAHETKGERRNRFPWLSTYSGKELSAEFQCRVQYSALINLEIEMTNTQGAISKGEAEPLKDTAENKVSQISTTSEKDALGDSSLDKVSGGGWPYATMSSQQVTPT